MLYAQNFPAIDNRVLGSVSRPMVSSDRPRLLVVDDEWIIRRLVADSLTPVGYEVETVGTGEEALAALRARAFTLVLSDVSMPGMSGLELLEAMGRLGTPSGAVLFSGCKDVPLAVKGMQLGALDYVLKPFRVDELRDSVQRALERHHLAQSAVRETKALRHEVSRLTLKMQEISEASLEGLVATLDAREGDTGSHSRRVSWYALRLAQKLGLSEDECRTIRRGALLHDIGKVAVPDRILLKNGPLTDAEWLEMRKHPETGFSILSNLVNFRESAELVLAHHERFDGGGYPNKLRGEDVPLGARIFSVVDTLDAMTSDRTYRKALNFAAAASEIRRCENTQFDPYVVRHFLAIPESDWTRIRYHSVA